MLGKYARSTKEESNLMRFPSPKLNYANVIATVALFVALGGVAVAAGLPKNSVGTQQLKSGAVKSADLRRGAVTSGKIAEGAVTPSKLADGAVTSGKLGDGAVTPAKLAADVGPLLGPLRSGQTLRGFFGLGAATIVAGAMTRDAVSFPFPLRSTPVATVLEPDQTSAHCDGLGGGTSQTPQAASGHLCVYITKRVNLDATEPLTVESPTRLGFGLVTQAGPLSEDYYAYGQWAVTAP
jgi:hypothetical protein